MIETLIALLSTSSVGAVVGGIFALLNKKVDNSVEIRKIELGIEVANINAAATVDAAVEGAEAARFTAVGQSHAADELQTGIVKAAGGWRWMLVTAEAFRRAVRPLATFILLAAALYAGYLVLNTQLQEQAFLWVTAQASTVLSYWFIARTGSSRG